MQKPLVLSRDQARNVDRVAIDNYGMNSLVLMENAARGCVEHLPGDGPVVICCGKGNNGGDGFAIARHLDNAGRPCRVFLFTDESELSDDAKANWDLLRWTDVECIVCETGTTDDFTEALANAEWIIDALLGTGTRGAIRDPFIAVIDTINASDRKVAAVDIPSGLEADTGELLGPCIRADRTWTFVGTKSGFSKRLGSSHVGEIFIVDIGVPQRMIHEAVGD